MPRVIAGDKSSGLLLIADHASNHVPGHIELGIDPALLNEHIAVDIGTWDLGHQLAVKLSAPAIFATISRLVIDLNREPDAPGLIPISSDGHEIPGNAALTTEERNARITRYWQVYHDRIRELIAEYAPKMLISLHSFTPQLQSDPDQKRPWEIGVLYNQDDRAARIAIPALEAAGIVTGDNLPYSGKILNATMNQHGEDMATAYLGLEIRQDLISDPAGIGRIADIITPIIADVRNRLA